MAQYLPVIASGYDGSLVRAWFEYNAGTSGPGKIKGQFRSSGDSAWSAAFTFKDAAAADLGMADPGTYGGFHVAMGFAGHAPWHLALVVDGETAVSDWFSCDDCRSFTRF